MGLVLTKPRSIVRPFVEFDPGNRDHRRYYNQWLHTLSWNDCPVRFSFPHNQKFAANPVQPILAAWYSENEFGKTEVAEGRFTV